MSIYEGTTGIHSLTLLGRGITSNGGKAPQLLFAKIMETIVEAKNLPSISKYAEQLEKELGRLQKVTMHLMSLAMKGDNEVFLADSNLYMEMFSLITVSWTWLKQGVVAQRALITKNQEGDELAFYEAKIQTMKFFFHYELIKTLSLSARLLDTEVLTVLEGEEVMQ